MLNRETINHSTVWRLENDHQSANSLTELYLNKAI